MRKVVSVTYKYIPLCTHTPLYRGFYCSQTVVGAWIKALWATRFQWNYFNYTLE